MNLVKDLKKIIPEVSIIKNVETAPDFFGAIFSLVVKMENTKILNCIGLATHHYYKYYKNNCFYKISLNSKIIPFNLSTIQNEFIRDIRNYYFTLHGKLDKNFEYSKSYKFARCYDMSIVPESVPIKKFKNKVVFSFCIYNHRVNNLLTLNVQNLTKNVFPSIFIITSPDINETYIWGNDKKPLNFRDLKNKFKFDLQSIAYSKFDLE